jgi:hypothetical protein
MPSHSEVLVTLSVGLLSQLRARAAGLDVPLDWLVAGLVHDTIESCVDGCLALPVSDSALLVPMLNVSS